MKVLLLNTICIFLLIPNIYANILDVPSLEYPTIQAGIDSAMTGDTVLVQPDTYSENINFMGKNIVVASLVISSEDTSYISKTIIDGGFTDRVVTFENGEDASAMLIGFTVSNGFNFPGGGGGIICKNNSSPTLEYLKITFNTAGVGAGVYCLNNSNPILSYVVVTMNDAIDSGAGIFCEYKSSPSLENVMFINNISNNYGGGLYFSDSCHAELSNVIISENYAIASGGGIFFELGSNLILDSVIIEKNWAEEFGGGIFCSESSPSFTNVIVRGDTANLGGGIFFESSLNVNFDKVIIENNMAMSDGGGMSFLESEANMRNLILRKNTSLGLGGGIYTAFSSLSFDPQNLCNIYLNKTSFLGNDLYSEEGDNIQVVVDTFTVLDPSHYQVYPIDSFSFTVSHGLVEQVANDLYVNPNGSDTNNSGLSQEQPLKTLFYAMNKVLEDSMNPRQIFLDKGIFSASSTGEIFPLNMKSFVSLQGIADSVAILDAEGEGSVLVFYDDKDITLNKIVLTGGDAELGGAIYCRNSNPVLSKVTVFDNSSSSGGGLYSWASTPTIINSIFWQNQPQEIYIEGLGDTSSILIAYSDVLGGKDNIDTNNNGTVFYENGNRDQNPMFVNSEEYDFTLSQGSPCLNRGTAFFVWQNDTIVNLSPDEYGGYSPDMGAAELITPNAITAADLIPTHYALFQNYPNPFNPVTTIHYQLVTAVEVNLSIYNILGQKVTTLIAQKQPAGSYKIEWNASKFASGIYYYRLEAGEFVATKKLTLLK